MDARRLRVFIVYALQYPIQNVRRKEIHLQYVFVCIRTNCIKYWAITDDEKKQQQTPHEYLNSFSLATVARHCTLSYHRIIVFCFSKVYTYVFYPTNQVR